MFNWIDNQSNILLRLALIVDALTYTIFFPLSPFLIIQRYKDVTPGNVGYFSGSLVGAIWFGRGLGYLLWEYAGVFFSKKAIFLISMINIIWSSSILGVGEDFYWVLACCVMLGLFNGIYPVIHLHMNHTYSTHGRFFVRSSVLIGWTFGPMISGIFYYLFRKSNNFDKAVIPLSSITSSLSILSFILFILFAFAYDEKRYNDNGDNKGLLEMGSSHNNDDTIEIEIMINNDTKDIPKNFLNSCNGDATKALINWRKDLQWRAEYDIDNLLNHPNPHFYAIRKILPHFFHGFSESGHLLFIDFIGKIDFKRLSNAGITINDIQQHYAFLMEFAIKKLLTHEDQKLIIIIDLNGLSLQHVGSRNIEIVGNILDMFQDHFPEYLHGGSVINIPFWFSWVWKASMNHLSVSTRNKVIKTKSSNQVYKLCNLVGETSLPKVYGGVNNLPIGESNEEKQLKQLVSSINKEIDQSKIVLENTSENIPHTSSLSGNDSDEEAFFDCTEYGLQDPDEESSQKTRKKNRLNLKTTSSLSTTTIASSSSSSSSSSSRTLQPNSSSLPSPGIMKRDLFDDNFEEEAIESPSGRVEISTYRQQIFHQSSTGLCKDGRYFKIFMIYLSWILVQSIFDETFGVWYLVSLNQVDDSIIYHIGTIGSTANCIALLVEVYASRYYNNCLEPLTSFRLGCFVQVLIILGFPFYGQLNQGYLSFLVLTLGILFTILLRDYTCIALDVLLENSVGVNKRFHAHRLAFCSGLFIRVFGCIIGPFSISLFHQLGLKVYPLNSFFPFFFMGLIGGFSIFISLLLSSSINSPRLFFL